MNALLFETLYKSRAEALRMKLGIKNDQYGGDDDFFENNRRAADVAGLTMERSTLVLAAKHFATLCRYAEDLDMLNVLFSDAPALTEDMLAKWRESMDDISIYMDLLNGMLEERYQDEH